VEQYEHSFGGAGMEDDASDGKKSASSSLDTDLLPTFQKYKQENESWIPDFDIWDYLSLRGDADLAAAFFKLFWPDFVEVSGCVILQHNYSPDNFTEWMERYSGDRRAVESMINHVHVWDLFLMSPKDVEYAHELYEFLAGALMRGWKSALQHAFPDKHFVFTLRHGYGPEVSFHQAEAE
jgi:hypothetical protein